LKEEADAVYATISDDGDGFDYASLLKIPSQERSLGRGLGLTGMQERAVLLNGNLDLHTAPGQGTRVEVRIPLPAGRAAKLKKSNELAIS
jgi:signal transduction histidine kinase